MKKMFICILLNVLIYNEIPSRCCLGQNYPYMDQYYSEEKLENTLCDDIICNKSGLMVVQIELLLNSFNRELNFFAEREKLSNAYRLYWSKYLAEIAQNKSSVCLPATYENGSKKFSLLDNLSLKSYNLSSNFNATLEVVIGERNITYWKEDEIHDTLFTANMVTDYTALFFSSRTDLASRALNKFMGCGYIYSRKNQMINDRLLCIFAFKYVRKHSFIAYRGPPCTKCDNFYQTDLNSTNGMIISRKTTWGCDQLFPYLCTDTLLILEPIEDVPFKAYCKDSEYDDTKIITVDDSKNETSTESDMEENEWPCLPILIPLAIVIIIFFALAAYHFATALKMQYNNT